MLPLVELDGEPFEQGRQHGLALRDQIAHNLDVYYDRFLTEGHLAADEVRSRAARYVPLFESYPEYFAAVRGVAEASGQDLLDLVMLNVRYELLYYQYSILPVGSPDGCTSFAVLPTASVTGHVLIGENWDWIPEVAGAVLHTRWGERETLAFTEAGIVGGKIGLNSAGLGLAINGLLSTEDDWSRLEKPFHVRCFEILQSPSLDAAAAIVSQTRRACSANFVLAQGPDRALSIEAAPDTSCSFGPSRGTLAHTNHFLEPTHLGVAEPPFSERRPQSYSRLARMRTLLDARRPLSVADVQSCLRDHDNYPDSVCRHVHPDDPPEEACPTVVSVVMDLNDRAMWLSNGPPCEHTYAEYRL
jgi:isopenicillin-N N-acyltransferase-like protein